MNNESNIAVALVKRLCPICVKPYDAEIVMNKKLTKKYAAKVSSMHGEIVGMMDHPCDQCKEDYTSKGFVFIGVDADKTSDMNNPFRTGNIWVITNDSAKKLINNKEILSKGIAYIDTQTACQIGLLKGE